MTNIPVVGKIVSIEVDNSPNFELATYSDLASGSRTVAVGDIVEAYCTDANQYSIYLNSNGNNNGVVTVSGINRLYRLRKLFSGSGYDWVADH